MNAPRPYRRTTSSRKCGQPSLKPSSLGDCNLPIRSRQLASYYTKCGIRFPNIGGSNGGRKGWLVRWSSDRQWTVSLRRVRSLVPLVLRVSALARAALDDTPCHLTLCVEEIRINIIPFHEHHSALSILRCFENRPSCNDSGALYCRF